MNPAIAPAVSENAPHPVDEVLPAGKLVALGIQHVLVMYAGAVAVPLIIGSALKLPVEQIALLITADLFICGVTSIIQSLGLTPWFGIRMPVMMGMTFASVTPMIAIATTPGMILGVTLAATRTSPRPLNTRTASPFLMPRPCASSGLIHTS